MKNVESQNLGGYFLPPSGRNSGFPVGGGKENMRLEALAPVMLASNGSETAIDSGHFSHDISRMPDTPPKNTGHRRVRSEIVTLPDDISFDSDLGVVGSFDGPDETEEDLFSLYLEMDNKLNSSSSTSDVQVQISKRTAINPPPGNHIYSSGDRSRVKHQYSLSMDGSTEETSSTDAKKSMSAAKLAELALVDPKRAKRIWANRQSAVRSKERKMRYIAELEREVQTLQTQTTSLSAQLTLLQRDAHGLIAENNELKLRLQTMERQVHMQDVLNEALKKEIHHLRVVTGQNPTNGGPMMNFPPPFRPNHPFHPNHQLLTAQQFQQLQFQTHMQHPPFQQQQQLQKIQWQQQLQQFQQHHASPPQPGQQLPENTDLTNTSSLST